MTNNTLDTKPRKADLSPTVVFELLASKRRRYLLQCLSTRSDQVASLEELTDYVASRCDEPASGRPAVAVELQHHHLPALTEAGVVDYDARTNCVRYYGDSLLEGCLELC